MIGQTDATWLQTVPNLEKKVDRVDPASLGRVTIHSPSKEWRGARQAGNERLLHPRDEQ